MNKVRDNKATEYVVSPQDPSLHIEGYGLLYEGRPLLVEDDSLEYSGYGGCLDHYVISQDYGMPYLVDLHTMRYYLATYHLKGSHGEAYKPEDSYNLVAKATPYHMTVSMQVGSAFNLRVTTKPLATPIAPYKLLPSECLYDTVSGPEKGTIIKILKYVPDDLVPGNEYVYDSGCDVDTYIGTATVGQVANYYRGDKYSYQVFRRESRYPEFYESLDMTTILALQRGLKE